MARCERNPLRLADSGVGKEDRNVLTDIEKTLPIVKAFYESGSYDRLDDVE